VPAPDADTGDPLNLAPTPARRRRAIIGGIVGLALVVAALVAVALRRHELASAWDALTIAPAWMVALALVSPLLNLVFVSLALWIITAKHGPVRPAEMLALVCGAWLLNYLPMRPGMFGRIAYHRKVNNIPISTSAALLVLSMGLTATAIALLVVLGLALRWTDSLAIEISIIAGTGGAIGLASLILGLTQGPWRIAAAIFLRYLDTLVWVTRYWLVFHMVGHALSFEQACAIAAVSQAATAIPISGNGLGLREWAVGLSMAALPSWFMEPGATSAQATALGLAGDLVNRGVEMAVAVPVGLIGMAWVARRLRQHANRPERAPSRRPAISSTLSGQLAPPDQP